MRFLFAVLLTLLSACSNSVMVPEPPRMELQGYGTLGIVEFASNADAAINALATRQLQEHIQSAQPGTRFIELGNREAVLASVGARQLDAEAARKIGAKYGVAAFFVGEVTYAEPKADLRISDVTKLDGSVRAELRGDISAKLIEATTGASVWSNSGWVKRPLGGVRVSADQGVSAAVSKADPRREMVPTLVFQLTRDFRPTSVRQAVK
jgi:hypothetical protein